MTQQSVNVNIEVPDGYRITCYRKPKAGEYYLDSTNSRFTAGEDFQYGNYFILEKLDPPLPPSPPPYILCPMDWSNEYRSSPEFHTADGCPCHAELGRLYSLQYTEDGDYEYGYRLLGYTDRENWTPFDHVYTTPTRVGYRPEPVLEKHKYAILMKD